ncbi:MAG: hypothetical protein RIE06_26025 [Roseibium album]|uniref:Uncharacterized protein n=1 Tax=Roseibium album TaxID=311410 RepID=A0A0M6ZAG0_9HYPH|nr:hypothetical protein [Roseibium album]MBG6144056.1 hypothetical protein [Labrenzia sp. EL_142]MBG6157472.1 hypothetical protein [Labrenzia sp. EL_162]MBG6196134.1 hypothetical protein [Labrenzia sp. EL_159]MBG6201562.1 hypothetical protein [Labrenzia sp. EL_13]MCR9059783.1 hypothetical protein [Paracoccaceae bacterium]
MSKNKDSKERQREDALRSLDRVGAESETIAGSTFVRMADRAKGHMSAADKNEDDQIEVWGTRIGRGAGLVFAIGLVIYLVVTYL